MFIRNGSTRIPCNSANCGKFFYGLGVCVRGYDNDIDDTVTSIL